MNEFARMQIPAGLLNYAGSNTAFVNSAIIEARVNMQICSNILLPFSLSPMRYSHLGLQSLAAVHSLQSIWYKCWPTRSGSTLK